ncbi:Glutamate synthase (NADPH) small chain [Anaerovibrio sp. JC8]|uniref:FAD-dependent oxidoreductase n=1 Tax=Anaerovibrio sp. JC8 TaxID=1240085 RepID=UPI000A0D36BB|nr:FAD-dependent oxidoreductase [Anaerovibrio sp. JC8]ORU00073.1 Glutamate synthase (NADPH) small chain [Anaerovibrio sp. JC8]
MSLFIVKEAERCLQCKKPMCMEGCPAHTNIPQVVQAFKENRLLEAGETLFENNPLSLVCSIVCDHEAQCTGHCVLGKKGSPIIFYEIERFISDSYLDRLKKKGVAENNGKQVAVIGAGPSGMTVAIILAKHGYNVTIFYDNDKIGGMLQYGIPDFRLNKQILERYKNVMQQMGIRFRPNTAIGESITIENLKRDGYASIFVGTGVWRPKMLGIEGETLANVHYGISYLGNPSVYQLGNNVAIIGMGNVAMDVARTALRHGSEHVTLYARSKRIAASENEVEFTRLDGAEFVFGRAIEKITQSGPVFRVAKFDENDNVTGYEEELEQVEADSVIIAVSQAPKNKLILTTEGLEGNDRGLLVIDENCMTTCEGVFSAGDVVHGSNTVVAAIHEAKKAAAGMMKYMEG